MNKKTLASLNMSTTETENLLITQDQTQKACKLLSEMTKNIQTSMDGVKSLTQLIKDGKFDSKKVIYSYKCSW